MQRKRLGYILIGGGLVLALFVGIMVYSQVSEAERVKASLPDGASSHRDERHSRPALRSRRRWSTSARSRTISCRRAPPPRVEDVVGKFSPDAVTKGEVINTQKIGPVAAKNAPSFRIEKGKVMYVMPVGVRGHASSRWPRSTRCAQAIASTCCTRRIDAPTGPDAPSSATTCAPTRFRTCRRAIMLQDLRIQEIGSYAADGSLVPATGDPTAKGAAASRWPTRTSSSSSSPKRRWS